MFSMAASTAPPYVFISMTNALAPACSASFSARRRKKN